MQRREIEGIRSEPGKTKAGAGLTIAVDHAQQISGESRRQERLDRQQHVAALPAQFAQKQRKAARQQNDKIAAAGDAQMINAHGDASLPTTPFQSTARSRSTMLCFSIFLKQHTGISTAKASRIGVQMTSGSSVK